jgi:glutamine amidotransferase
MGWNKVSFVKNTSCGAKDDFFYFVNSYYAKPDVESDIWGVADFGGMFAAAACRDNIFATQFHVEKSGKAGLELFASWLRVRG